MVASGVNFPNFFLFSEFEILEHGVNIVFLAPLDEIGKHELYVFQYKLASTTET